MKNAPNLSYFPASCFARRPTDTPSRRIKFICSRLFFPQLLKPFTEEEKQAARKAPRVFPDTKIILIAGGRRGEGAGNLVKAFLKQDLGVHIAVVCGKNRLLKVSRLPLFAPSSRTPVSVRLRRFYERSDERFGLHRHQGGPSRDGSLAVRKPVILSTFIRPQERGNMLFIVENKVGWYYSDLRK